jgi:hypothetical protein
MPKKRPLTVSARIFLLRTVRRRRVRTSLLLLLPALLYFLLMLPLSLRHAHSSTLARYDASVSALPPPRVFVASMLANCAPLLRSHWIPSLLGLIDRLGPENVYVSILENGSVDDTRLLLQGLRSNLSVRGVPSSFRFEESFRDGVAFEREGGLLTRLLGEEGTGDNWIWTDSGWFPRRISYLAQLRNMVLEPLRQTSRTYDKILFINDVIFSVPSLPLTLLFFELRTTFT